MNELENFSAVNVTVLCLAGGCGIQKRGKEHNGFAIHYQTCSAVSLPPLRSLFLWSPPVTRMQRMVILFISSSTFLY